MISGLNEKELDIANQIADLLLEKERLQQENKQLIEINENKQKEIDKLVCIIYKAIEYIKENDYHYMNEYALERFRNNLLEILGDKENGVKEMVK